MLSERLGETTVRSGIDDRWWETAATTRLDAMASGGGLLFSDESRILGKYLLREARAGTHGHAHRADADGKFVGVCAGVRVCGCVCSCYCSVYCCCESCSFVARRVPRFGPRGASSLWRGNAVADVIEAASPLGLFRCRGVVGLFLCPCV